MASCRSLFLAIRTSERTARDLLAILDAMTYKLSVLPMVYKKLDRTDILYRVKNLDIKRDRFFSINNPELSGHPPTLTISSIPGSFLT